MVGAGVVAGPGIRSPLPRARSCVCDRQQAPVGKVAFPGGEETWLVTRFADGHAALSDARPGAPDGRDNRRDAA